MPRIPLLAFLYVTTPPACAPRIIVTETIALMMSRAIFLFRSDKTIRPKFPQRKIPLQCLLPKASELKASKAVMQKAKRTCWIVLERLRVTAARRNDTTHPVCRMYSSSLFLASFTRTASLHNTPTAFCQEHHLAGGHNSDAHAKCAISCSAPATHHQTAVQHRALQTSCMLSFDLQLVKVLVHLHTQSYTGCLRGVLFFLLPSMRMQVVWWVDPRSSQLLAGDLPTAGGPSGIHVHARLRRYGGNAAAFPPLPEPFPPEFWRESPDLSEEESQGGEGSRGLWC